MADFQRRCPSIQKTSEAKVVTQSGGNYSYNYAELDEIARTVNPILAELGLSYTWDSEVTDASLTCRCTLRHSAGHHVTSSFTCPIDTTAKMNGTQKAGAALTYARRQSLVSVLGLTTTDPDTDGSDRSGATISDEQEANIMALVTEMGIKLEGFLKWCKVERVNDILAKDYHKVMSALIERRKK
jgi:hypothetical protein